MDFLNKLNTINCLPLGIILETLDNTALYNNTPHNEGIDTCRAMLNTTEVQQPLTEDPNESNN